MRAAIYCRVSTNMQEEKNSLENQIERCEMFCKIRDFEVVKIFKDVETGINDERNDFVELKKAAASKMFDVIIVTELQRLTRKLTTLLSFVTELHENDINFISISQNFDTTTAIGRAMLKLIGVFAEFEREQTSERISHTFRALAQTGRWLAGEAPFGYKLIDGKLHIVEQESEEVRKIFDLYMQGSTLNDIARQIGCSASSVSRRLQNPTYCGKVRFGYRKTNILTGTLKRSDDFIISKGQHEAIISEEVFDTAQARMNSLYKKNVKTSDNPNYLLGGLIKCYCGRTMYGVKNPNGYKYYSCSARSGTKTDKCPKKSIKVDPFETKILDLIADLKQHPEHLKLYQQSDEDIIPNKNIDKLIKKKTEIEKKKDRLIDFLLDGTLSREQYNIRESKISEEMRIIDDEVSAFELQKMSREIKMTNQEMFLQLIKQFDDTDRMGVKKLLAVLVKEIRFINDFEYQIFLNI
jgi:DNA invertase Pin-like site-specific DNA recombinase